MLIMRCVTWGIIAGSSMYGLETAFGLLSSVFWVILLNLSLWQIMMDGR